MRVVGLLPETHLHLLSQGCIPVLIKNDKNLIGGRWESKLIPFLHQGIPDSPGCLHGSAADSAIQVIRKEGLEHDPCDPPFCQQRAMLFDDREQMRNVIMLRNNNRFPEKRTALGSANIEDIAQSGQIRQCHVVFRTGKGIGESCAVHIERNRVFSAYTADLLQFLKGIKRPVLGRLGEIDGPGHDHVVVIVVLPEGIDTRADLLCRDFPVVLFQSQNFMSACLDRAGFMDADMSADGSDHALVRTQHGIDHGGVRLCAAGQEVNIRFRCLTGDADLLPCRF